jgi:hypothetical protein
MEIKMVEKNMKEPMHEGTNGVENEPKPFFCQGHELLSILRMVQEILSTMNIEYDS